MNKTIASLIMVMVAVLLIPLISNTINQPKYEPTFVFSASSSTTSSDIDVYELKAWINHYMSRDDVYGFIISVGEVDYFTTIYINQDRSGITLSNDDGSQLGVQLNTFTGVTTISLDSSNQVEGETYPNLVTISIVWLDDI